MTEVRAAQAQPAQPSTPDWAIETALDPALTFAPRHAGNAEQVLLTGGNGFLGVFILRELLRGTSAHVYALARDREGKDADARIRATYAHYFPDEALDMQRFHPLTADLRHPMLGLSEATFASLAETIESIIHVAAEVNWARPYAQLKPSNVTGTVELLRLASTGKPKSFDFVSTVGASPGLPPPHPPIPEDVILESPELIATGYSRTKWVSERLVHEGRKRGLVGRIYRFAFATGDAERGRMDLSRTNFVPCLIRGLIELGYAPDIQAGINLLPVDFVARAITRFSRDPQSGGSNFNLLNTHQVPYTDLYAVLRAMGYKIEVLPYDAWMTKLLASARNPLLLFLDYLKRAISRGLTVPPLDTRNATAAYARVGMELPVTDAKLLDVYVRYMIDTGYLPRP